MPKRQLRVGTQWLYVDEAEKLLREAMRIQAGYSPRGEYVGEEVAGDAGEATPPAGSC